MFLSIRCHVRTPGYKLASIPTSLACHVIALSCPACLVFQRLPGPFEATKTRSAGLNGMKTVSFVDENRKKEMRGKSWRVPDLIAEQNSK